MHTEEGSDSGVLATDFLLLQLTRLNIGYQIIVQLLRNF